MRLRSLMQTLTLSSGTIFNAVLGLIFYVLVGRALSVEAFGYFSFLLGIGVLAADLGDMGVDQSIIRFGHAEGFKAVFTVGTLQRLIVGVLFIVIAIIAQLLYPANFLLSALVGWSLLLVYVTLQSFLAKQRYLLYASTNIFGNAIRLALVAVMISWNILAVETALGSVIIANIAATILGFIFLTILERGMPFVFSGLKETVITMIRFGGWIGLSFATSALAAKLDSPLVFSLAGGQAAGLYSSAQRLSSLFPQLAGALDGVFSPKLAQGDPEGKHFKEYLVLGVIGAGLLLMTIPFMTLLLGLVFGNKYEAAAPLLQVMILGLSLFFLSGPFVSAVIYRFGKSQLHFISSVVQLVMGVSLMLVLIPRFGAMGAAMSFVLMNVVNLFIFVISYIKLSRRSA